MEIENRFNAIADDPVGRLIRVHSASLEHAANRPSPAPVSSRCDRADIGQCRGVVNSLLREIDRLRRGVDRIDGIYTSAPTSVSAVTTSEDVRSSLTAAAAPSRPPLYAPDPIGKIVPKTHDEPPPQQAIHIENYYDVTNLGTLLDILA